MGKAPHYPCFIIHKYSRYHHKLHIPFRQPLAFTLLFLLTKGKGHSLVPTPASTPDKKKLTNQFL